MVGLRQEDTCITNMIWDTKYRYKEPNGFTLEHSRDHTHQRVVGGVYSLDPRRDIEAPRAFKAMSGGLWCPAGRIHAGAGTGKRVTLANCFVSGSIEDSLSSDLGVGIMDSLRDAAVTQQMGGGIGMDFSPLRPKGAIVRRTGSISEGPLVFMDMWDAMCRTIQSAGARRGAMMATLRVDHPDILSFVSAKRTEGRLTNFNVSVLVTDEFMLAVKNDKPWTLGHKVAPAEWGRDSDDQWHIYETVSARHLWDEILKNTYHNAEPGIIFIDRVNYENNLFYCEDIAATNPCGEQPLPPYGTCNLGATNLAKMVDNPFTSEARVNTAKLRDTVDLGVRFLDNVLDVTQYPLPQQRLEAQAKRRLGLGITGLANMLQQLMIRYGSDESADRVRFVMSTIRNQAYRTSIELSRERGPFGAYEREAYMSAPFIDRLPGDIKAGINKYGIRNGVLLTVAPTGTTSIYYDNVSSGIEPTFSFSYLRNVKAQNGDTVQYEVEDYGYKHFRDVVLGGRKPNGEGLPPYMVTALELSVDEHLKIQAVCQEHVDASISKTINCPKDMTFEDFKHVYDSAYSLGLKGCTTYRDAGTRGNVLSVAPSETSVLEHVGSECPSCGEMALVNQEGCEQCFACGFGKCSI